ncbi:MAG: hypothetical protein WBO34_10915 [Gammaproteobacteria bacterium]
MTLRPRNTANTANSCRQQMDEVKGKPQRRHSVVERYTLEYQPPAN